MCEKKKIISNESFSLYENEDMKIVIDKSINEIEVTILGKIFYIYPEETEWLYNELKKIFE